MVEKKNEDAHAAAAKAAVPNAKATANSEANKSFHSVTSLFILTDAADAVKQ